jgi:hypothetical protein
MTCQDDEDLDALAAAAIERAGGNRRKAARTFIDAALAIVRDNADDRRWLSEVLLNDAADCDPDLDKIFDPGPVH